MRAGKYSYKELFVNRYVEQLVVPEIQRDYVWQEPQLKGFLESLAGDFRAFRTASVPDLEAVDGIKDPSLQQDFDTFYRRRNYSANIGFIYAYSDEQYPGRYFLIDGQQRITTLYLLLVVLAARCGRADDFRKSYCQSNGVTKLDYRVRDATSLFLQKLVALLLEDVNANVSDQAWFLDNYQHDPSISTMLANIGIIRTWLDTGSLEQEQFFDYIQNYTEFWYFDTNISAQGENLYIYLNARGEQVQQNENLKADLLSKLPNDDEKNKWGRTWEDWQDLFWRKRGSNSTADNGFNSFLGCIAALKQYLCGDQIHLHKDKATQQLPVTVLSDMLELEDVERYIQVLRYLDDSRESFKELYAYADWIDDCIDQIWRIFNEDKTDWFVVYPQADKLSMPARNMVFVWGVLHWVDSARALNSAFEQVFRAIRHFYLRYFRYYHRHSRAEGQIKESVNNLLENGFISREAGREEYKRERWLAGIDDIETRRKLESLLWKVEDHPYNLDGATNITHLVEFNDDLTLEKLQAIYEALQHCFPSPKSYRENRKELQSLLLHYGEYWQRQSPWYYKNYQFNDWKKIIRGLPIKDNSHNDVFRRCLTEIIESGKTISQLLAEKRAQYQPDRNLADLHSQLLWYNHYLQETMWDQGGSIALGRGGPDEPDPEFPNRQLFRNTKGDFKGWEPKVLAQLLPDEIKQAIGMSDLAQT